MRIGLCFSCQNQELVYTNKCSIKVSGWNTDGQGHISNFNLTFAFCGYYGKRFASRVQMIEDELILRAKKENRMKNKKKLSLTSLNNL